MSIEYQYALYDSINDVFYQNDETWGDTPDLLNTEQVVALIDVAPFMNIQSTQVVPIEAGEPLFHEAMSCGDWKELWNSAWAKETFENINKLRMM